MVESQGDHSSELGSEDPFYEIAKRLEAAAFAEYHGHMGEVTKALNRFRSVVESLTGNESIVYRMTSNKVPQAEIAQEIGRSPRTVRRIKNRVEKILDIGNFPSLF